MVSTVSFLEADRIAVAPGGRIYEQMERDLQLSHFVRSRLGQNGIFRADRTVQAVIARVMTKTAAGLLFYEFGRTVPLSDLSVLAIEHSKNANPSAVAEMYRRDDNGWEEVTPSGRMLERQALAFLGHISPYMPKWRTYIPEFFEYQFLRRSNGTMLTALLVHGSLIVFARLPLAFAGWSQAEGPSAEAKAATDIKHNSGVEEGLRYRERGGIEHDCN